jgi:uncharacterized integral membrane protein
MNKSLQGRQVAVHEASPYPATERASKPYKPLQRVVVHGMMLLSALLLLLVVWLVISVVFHLFAGVLHLIGGLVGLLLIIVIAVVVYLAYKGRRWL